MNLTTDQNQFRHEWKHLISTSDAEELRHRLLSVTRHDPNNPGPYKVRSLYFDNPYDKALQEKLDGLEVREKFRIRYYNGNTGFIRLEKKSKRGALCGKETTPVTKEQCLRLISGDTVWMAGTDDLLLTELHAKMQYQLLRPRTLVDYTREAFVYAPGNVRVTIDSNIRTGLSSTALFDQTLPTLSIDSTQTIILEVKYDAFLPDIIRDMVQVKDRRTTSFSKYAASRAFG